MNAWTNALFPKAITFEGLIDSARSNASNAELKSGSANQITRAAAASVVASSFESRPGHKNGGRALPCLEFVYQSGDGPVLPMGWTARNRATCSRKIDHRERGRWFHPLTRVP